MPDIAQISRAIDYIEDNLKEPLGVADMAQAVSYSLFHFCRMFNESTHHTPYDYMMRRRLSEAATELATTDRKVVEIAFDYQFNSHEAFTRAFKRMFEQQPRRFREQGRIGRWQLMPRLTLEHLQQIAGGSYLRPVLEERDALRIAGVMAYVRDTADVAPELWRLFARQWQSLSPAPSRCRFYGITYYTDDGSIGKSLYLTGVQVGASAGRHHAWVEKRIPAQRYATFTHKGSRRDLNLTLDYIFHTWLPKSGETIAHPWVMEHHGRSVVEGGDQDTEMRLSIPIKPDSDQVRPQVTTAPALCFATVLQAPFLGRLRRLLLPGFTHVRDGRTGELADGTPACAHQQRSVIGTRHPAIALADRHYVDPSPASSAGPRSSGTRRSLGPSHVLRCAPVLLRCSPDKLGFTSDPRFR